MKISRRLTAVIFSIVMLFSLLSENTRATESIDFTHSIHLSISCQDGDTPLTGAQFNIYLVAQAGASGELTATETFSRFPVDLWGQSSEAWRTLASTLEGYVLRDAISPTDSGKTDACGLVTFPAQKESLTPGLYLVLGNRHIQDGCVYEATAFLVMLPGWEEKTKTWIYDITAKAKHESGKIPDSSDTVTRKVLKIWKDSGREDERPQEILVYLLRDGKIYDTVRLSAINNWQYTWQDLDPDHQWIAVEKEPEGYTVEATHEGSMFIITNTYTKDSPDEPTVPVGPSQPSEPTLPQTGQLWWPVPMLTSVGLLLIIIGLIRRRGTHNGT